MNISEISLKINERRLKVVKKAGEKTIVLYVAASLDGYIARKDGSVDWLYGVTGEGDNGYHAFYDTVDTIIMGNKTYEHMKKLADEFPYKGKECYVFCRRHIGNDENVQFINDNIANFIQKLQGQITDKKIWIVGGAELLVLFLKENLVDEFIISIMPTILGEGISLFKSNNPEINLKLINIQQYGEIAQLYYERRTQYDKH